MGTVRVNRLPPRQKQCTVYTKSAEYAHFSGGGMGLRGGIGGRRRADQRAAGGVAAWAGPAPVAGRAWDGSTVAMATALLSIEMNSTTRAACPGWMWITVPTSPGFSSSPSSPVRAAVSTICFVFVERLSPPARSSFPFCEIGARRPGAARTGCVQPGAPWYRRWAVDDKAAGRMPGGRI